MRENALLYYARLITPWEIDQFFRIGESLSISPSNPLFLLICTLDKKQSFHVLLYNLLECKARFFLFLWLFLLLSDSLVLAARHTCTNDNLIILVPL